jgi:single-strand DNA-binding protein
MANVNRHICIGTLTRDVEIRVTPKGTPIGTFSLAVNRKWKDEQGGEKEEVSFLEFEAFGKTAEIIAKYTEKGRQLYVESRAKQDVWTDKETDKKRSKIKFIVENFQLLGGRRDGNQGGSNSEKEPNPHQDRSPQPSGGGGSLGDDVPFAPIHPRF